MTMICDIDRRGCDAIFEGLRAEFGAIMADRILEAEAVDFLWDARVKERYLGQHFSFDLGDGECEGELSRIAVLSAIRGRWHAALCLVDGDGDAAALLWRTEFPARREAEIAFETTR